MGFLSAVMRTRAGAVSESEFRGVNAWLNDEPGLGMPTSAGLRIKPENMVTLSAVFAAARAISEDVACLPLKVYRSLPEGGKEEARNDPVWETPDGRRVNLYRLIHDAPNRDMDDLAFRSLLLWWAQLYGNAYAEIKWDRMMNPLSLEPLHPHTVEVKRDDRNNVYYRHHDAIGQERDIRPWNMIHIKGVSDDGLVGLMISRVGADAFGIYLAAERFTGKFFGNGATLAGVVTFDQPFKTPEALEEYRRKFNERYQGSTRSHQWMLADSGAKVQVTGADPEKSQLVDTIRFRIEDVARWFRVPPVIIGHNTSTPYTNVESLGQIYTRFGMKPWALRTEKELTRKLVPVNEPEVFVEHVIDGLMWADAKTRAEVQNLRIRGGWGNPNEARAIHNMNPIPGGDRFRIETNMAVLGDDGMPVQNTTPRPAGVGVDDSTRIEAAKLAMMPVFVDAADRMIAREAKGIANKKSPTSEWIARFYDGHRPEVAAAFRPAIDTLSRMVGVEASGVADRYADEHVGESIRRLEAGECPMGWALERPALIAKQLTDRVCHE